MISSKAKFIAVVLAIVIGTGIVTTGCKSKSERHTWVNTTSMPGNTFADHTGQTKSSTIVYLGDNKQNADSGFGPKDVSFDFKNLKR